MISLASDSYRIVGLPDARSFYEPIPAERALKHAGIASRVTYYSTGHMTAVAHYMLPLLPTACLQNV